MNDLGDRETLLKIYSDYFSSRKKENLFITASLGTGKNYALNEVLSKYNQSDDELIVYSAPTLQLKDAFVEAHNAYNLDFVEPEEFRVVLKRCNYIESAAFEYIYDKGMSKKHHKGDLLKRSKIACTHTSLLKGQMSSFLRTRSLDLSKKSLITIIVDESFLDHMIQTCTITLSEFKLLDIDPHSLEGFTPRFDYVKRDIINKDDKDLTDTDKRHVAIINKIDVIRSMGEREVSEDISDGGILYSYTGRVVLSYLDQPNIRFIVLDACGDVEILRELLGIPFDVEKTFKPKVDPSKVHLWYYKSKTASRASKSSKETMNSRVVDYKRLKHICDEAFGRQSLELSGLTHYDLAKELHLKGHFRNSAGKNYWETNNYLIIYGLYYHHKGDLDIKVSHFVNMRTEDFCDSFDFDWVNMEYTLKNNTSIGRDKLALANKLVNYIYESVITQSIGRIRFHRHLFNPETNPINIIIACPECQISKFQKYLPPELKVLQSKSL